MPLLSSLVGKRRMLELLEVISERQPVYLKQLTKGDWNAMTGCRLLRELETVGLIAHIIEGGKLGESMKKVYRRTPKGEAVLNHAREIQKLLDGRLGGK